MLPAITRTTPPSVSAVADRPIPRFRSVDAPRSLRATLTIYRAGAGDPTTRLTSGRFLRATHTPDGPATLSLTWRTDPAPVDADGLDAQAWGAGAAWVLERVDRLTGRDDTAIACEDAPPVITRALASNRTHRVGSSANLYHELLPTILAQRITAREAARQWARLARRLGEPAPGPIELVGDLRLPPSPASLHRRPAWWFHRLGIEAKRARTLTEVARHASKLDDWATLAPDAAVAKLSLISGVGPWTTGSVAGPALGDPDAVPVGDFHLPNAVAWALAGEPRADDDRMLELLEPYRGQRGRVLRAIVRTSGPAPKYGPRRRTLPVARL